MTLDQCLRCSYADVEEECWWARDDNAKTVVTVVCPIKQMMKHTHFCECGEFRHSSGWALEKP